MPNITEEKIQATEQMREDRREIIELQAELTPLYNERNKNNKKAKVLKKQLQDAVIGFGVATKVIDEKLRELENEDIEEEIKEKETEKNRLSNLFYFNYGIWDYDSKINWRKLKSNPLK